MRTEESAKPPASNVWVFHGIWLMRYDVLLASLLWHMGEVGKCTDPVGW